MAEIGDQSILRHGYSSTHELVEDPSELLKISDLKVPGVRLHDIPSTVGAVRYDNRIVPAQRLRILETNSSVALNGREWSNH